MDIEHQRVNDYDMAYVEAGAGPPLVLVHGSLCDLRYWPLQARALCDQFRVVSVSLRHYFPERWRGQDDDFTPQQHASDVAAFIQAMDLGPTHLLGHSRGGYVALEVARHYADNLASLILADPGGDLSPALQPDGSQPAVIDKNMLEGCYEHLRRDEVDDALALFVDTVHSPGMWARSPEKFKNSARDNAYTLLKQAGEPREPFTAAMLERITLPTLLIGGEHSPAPFPQILDAMERTMPNARRVTITGGGHSMNLEQPEAFNEAVRGFLTSL